MDNIYLCARAKINVALEIVGKRSDGYHDLRTIMQTVSLFDSVYILKHNGGIMFDTNKQYLNNNDNLAYKAAKYMLERYNINCGLRIYLEKRIPVAAGLGGGSSDCAAVIRGINELFELNIPQKELITICELFGSDVPFFMMQGTALAEGKGEQLRKLHNHPQAIVLIVKPDFDVSTKDIFMAFKQSKSIIIPDINSIIESLERNDLTGICSNICNMLESVTVDKYPIIAELKGMMIANGALGSLMSGSGPSVFGYFSDYSTAAAAGDLIRRAYPNFSDIHVCRIA